MRVRSPWVRSIGAGLVVALASWLAFAWTAQAAPATLDTAADPSPAGANDWKCKPSAEHPRPVVLVHGTWAGMSDTWKVLSPALKEAGYCVFALDYGKRAPGSVQNLFNMVGGDTIASSAKTLATFVNRVRQGTGAAQVDIVGHSQGALVARQYLKFNGGTNAKNPAANAVRTMVSLSGTNHGTTFNFNQTIGAIGQLLGIPVVTLAATTVGPSYVEQMVGSPFLARLNAGGDTRPGVHYVAVGTRNDNIVTPPERTFLTAGPGATVSNVWVQDGCPSLDVDHMGMTKDARAICIVLNALDPNYGATHKAPCN